MASAPPQILGLTDWRPLARGGFATVWEARQESLNRLVAVKVDERRLDADAEQRRFLREAGAAGRMSGHPGIVTVHDAGILGDDRPFLVMELCPGGSLTPWLTAENRPTQKRVRDVGIRIADALAAAHSRGVLHRDVKPANILIDSYDNPGLADFGLAALPEPGEELAETLEAMTPAYAPPETFRQTSPTEFGDVYGLAATLYALLGGRPPRGAGDAKPTIASVLDQFKNPIAAIPGVEPAFMTLLLEAMADTPTDRPTAAQLRDRLSALTVPDRTIQAEPVRDGEKKDRPAQDLPVAPSGPKAPPEALPSVVLLPPEPVGEGDHTIERRERRRSLVVLAVVAVLLVVAVIVTVAIMSPNRQTGQPAAQPVTSGPVDPTAGPSTAQPSPSTQTGVPDGFTDCSDQLGPQTYCAASYECWGGLTSLNDSPNLATEADCEETHIYQTFAAGRLAYEVRRQSQLDEDTQVQTVCRASLANALLASKDRRSDWEVFALPPQNQSASDNLYRCIFGRGEREKPLLLQKPR
ncbi:MAG TPA: protein kinase [Propionibacteriaceae bacterium]